MTSNLHLAKLLLENESCRAMSGNPLPYLIPVGCCITSRHELDWTRQSYSMHIMNGLVSRALDSGSSSIRLQVGRKSCRQKTPPYTKASNLYFPVVTVPVLGSVSQSINQG